MGFKEKSTIAGCAEEKVKDSGGKKQMEGLGRRVRGRKLST